MPTDQTFVIVGASLAGAKAAETLREEGFAGRLVLIGAEDERPYERPPPSKEYLRGEAGRDKIYRRSVDSPSRFPALLTLAGWRFQDVAWPKRPAALPKAESLYGTAMTDFSKMRHSSSSSMDPRAAAIRMVAAAEFFKSAGELPSWARTELESWSRADARDVGGRSPDVPAT